MGMFDTVIIEGLKLPTLPREVSSFLEKNNKTLPNDFQTKDLDNCLGTYIIDSKRQVFLIEYKPTGKKIKYESPFINWVDNRSFLERMYFKIINKQLDRKFPSSKFVEERKAVRVKSKLTNTFEIYNYVEINGRYIDVRLSVVAIDGKVKEIVLIEASVESEKKSKERHKQNQDFDKKFAMSIEKRNQLKSRWYYPAIKELYNPLVFFASKIIQRICNKIISISYRWSGI